MKKLFIAITLLLLLISGCVSKNAQTLPPPTVETLELAVGRTTAADINRLIIPTYASPVMASYRIARQNVILNVNITEASGVSYTNTLDLRLSGYSLNVIFTPYGTLASYMLSRSYR